MDLSREEARELFPKDRGESIRETDTEHWVSIEREDLGYAIITRGGSGSWWIPASKMSELRKELSDRGFDTPSIWTLLRDRNITESVVSEIGNQNS